MIPIVGNVVNEQELKDEGYEREFNLKLQGLDRFEKWKKRKAWLLLENVDIELFIVRAIGTEDAVGKVDFRPKFLRRRKG